MAQNPYELRWELLVQAKDHLVNEYQSLESRWLNVREAGGDAGEHPKYPTEGEILALADKWKTFVDGGEHA
mgnify:FL=1|tara:strand:+ start:641 stop:853 length:213 start_codon:yes stop_codon:yes gene_type:complete